MRPGKILIIVTTLGAVLAAGVMVYKAVRQDSPAVSEQRATSPLDALTPDERALYQLVERSIVAPIEQFLSPPERPVPGEKVDRRKRLLTELEVRASVAKIAVEDLGSSLASMAAKVRARPGISEDIGAVAALAAMDFEALREPAEGTPAAWRVWLALGKSHLAGWQIPELAKALERAMALWPPDANPGWKRSVTILYARSLGWLERFAESEAVLRAHGPQSGGPAWPETEVGLWANELTGMLRAQGKLAEAEPEARRVLELAEKIHGLVHANVATSSANLAYLVAERGNLDEAARLILRAEAVGEKTIPPADHRRMEWAIFHGSILAKQNKPAEAAAVMERALVRAEKQYGNEHFLVLELRRGIAECARLAGARSAGDRLENETLADMDDLVRENDPARAGILSTQAAALTRRGDLAGAERVYRRVVELLDKGGAPSERGAAHADLCQVLFKLGRNAEAKQLLERAVGQTEAARGESAPELVRLLQLLALIRRAEGKPAVARMLLERTVSIAEKSSGQGSQQALIALGEFAGFEQVEGRYTEAEKLFRRILDGQKKLSGPKSRDSIDVTFMLARCIREQRRHAEAISIFKEGLKLADEVLPKNDPNLINYLTQTAGTYQNLQRHADAKPLARRALGIALEARGQDHPDTATAAATLATSLFAHGEDAEAEKLLRTAVMIAGKNPGRMHPEMGNWFIELARICFAKAAYEDAESLSRAALAIIEGQVPADHPLLITPLARLGNLLALRGNNADGEALLGRALTIASRGLGPESPVPDVVEKLRESYGNILRAQGVARQEIESRIRATVQPRKP